MITCPRLKKLYKAFNYDQVNYIDKQMTTNKFL